MQKLLSLGTMADGVYFEGKNFEHYVVVQKIVFLCFQVAANTISTLIFYELKYKQIFQNSYLF